MYRNYGSQRETEIESLRKEYTDKYINRYSDSDTDIFTNNLDKNIKEKSGIEENIEKIKNYKKKKSNCSKTKKKWYSFGKAQNSRQCNNECDTLIKKQFYDALNKLYSYSKRKLTKKNIPRLPKKKKTDQTISSINKYTKIMSEIYDICKSNTSTPNPYNYKNLLNKLNKDDKLKQFYELNDTYINFLYKNRKIQDGNIFVMINELTGINSKIKEFMENKDIPDEICKV